MCTQAAAAASAVLERKTLRLHCIVSGAVQGVGFRPFVYRLATECGLAGWVKNSAQGVLIELEGPRSSLQRFLLRLETEAPPRASIHGLESYYVTALGSTDFEIQRSSSKGSKTSIVLPDIATCQACIREIFDPSNRRYGYPFTNCTNCGPRFSIIEARPYDRSYTTMKNFVMCEDCQAEYEDPGDRRFHAQPNACPACGPQLSFWDASGKQMAQRDAALRQAVDVLRRGAILAVKGIGGFHLMVDARSEADVVRLRRRKQREEKPFALMYHVFGAITEDCHVSDLEARLLRSPEAPIVLLQKQQHSRSGSHSIARSVAPTYPTHGVMLPYSPLHHLLLRELGAPVVATSGNLSDEPICTDEQEALRRLHGIADAFLVHDRPIARSVDDSVVRIVMGRELMLRRARGFAPMPVGVPACVAPLDQTPGQLPDQRGSSGAHVQLLAVGAHLKNTIGFTDGANLLVSQHIGDLETVEARAAFRKTIEDVKTLYEHHPEVIACDLHPDYYSTQFALKCGAPVVTVQHHHAHIASCMEDNGLVGSVLGVAWDGTGYGPDNTVWGGEFLRASRSGFTRVACFRRFRLPGGDTAVREPRRAALGLLYEIFGDELFAEASPSLANTAFAVAELRVLKQMLSRGINAPLTSSAGRIFDSVAALLELRQRASYEAQAAAELETASLAGSTHSVYPFHLDEGERAEAEPSSITPQFVIDWEPMIRAMLDDHKAGVSVSEIAAKFHSALAAMIVAVAETCGEERVVLTGGCFQNVLLAELAVTRLQVAGFRVFWHQRIPPNDGGIAIGQAAVARSWVMGRA